MAELQMAGMRGCRCEVDFLQETGNVAKAVSAQRLHSETAREGDETADPMPTMRSGGQYKGAKMFATLEDIDYYKATPPELHQVMTSPSSPTNKFATLENIDD
jgi:hypothetical protein